MQKPLDSDAGPGPGGLDRAASGTPAGEREEIAAIREIAGRLPALRLLAESMGAARLAALLEQAETQAFAHIEVARSIDTH